MAFEWTTIRAADFIEFNPRLSIKKNAVATKVAMDKLQPFTKKIPATEQAEFAGGSKFCNGDTIMARITPCLENGKTAFVDVLQNGEVGFGSTEFIVMRARDGISDPQFIYYLATSPTFRNVAIKSMVGSSGRQRVQQGVLDDLELVVPPLDDQQKIGAFLALFDEKIALNNKINDNLQQQAFALFDKLITTPHPESVALSEIAELNPKRSLDKNRMARCIDMAQLSTSGSFPNGWEIKPYNGGMRFANGDTLFARITPCLENGKTAYIDFLDADEVAFGSTEYVVMCSQGQYPSEFFYCLARYPSFVDYAVKNMNGSSGRQRVSAETIGKYILPRITDDELAEFRDVVPALFSAIRLNSFENISLAELRDVLLPKLMSDEIDVSDIQI